MFVSYEFPHNIGYNVTHGSYDYRSKVIDTEFIEEIITFNGSLLYGVDRYDVAIGDIIGVYSRRNLNVAANLALAIKWLVKNVTWGRSINDIIVVQRYQFTKYEKELEKYLILL